MVGKIHGKIFRLKRRLAGKTSSQLLQVLTMNGEETRALMDSEPETELEEMDPHGNFKRLSSVSKKK